MVTLDSVLAPRRGAEIYFEPVGGNHGDTLIEMGSRCVLERYGIRVVEDPSRAETIVINGSGSLGVELWNKNLVGLHSFAQTFRAQPLVILPSSFHFEADHLAMCFVNRSAPAYLLARDRYSLDLLAAQTFPSDVHTGIGDDMAFALRDSPFFKGLQARSAARQILLVERFDIEATTAPPQPMNMPRSLKLLTPGPVKRTLKKFVHRRRVAASTFTPTSLERLYAEAPQFRGLPVVAEDISSNVGFTFDRFLDAIVNAAVVVTTRLHVGILAALLEKPTYLIAGRGAYPKIKGVYEYSLATLPNVCLW